MRKPPRRPSRIQQQQQTARNRRTLVVALGGVVALAVIVVVVMLVVSGGGDSADDSTDIAFNGSPLGRYDPQVANDPGVGQKAPIFVTEDLDGTSVVTGVGAGPNDTARLIGFFAHWCPVCQAEVPRLVEWMNANELPPGVDLITVSTLADPGADNYPPDAWFAAEGWPLPVLRDSNDGQIAEAFGSAGVPYWVVLNNNNVVLARRSGELSNQEFEELVALASASQGN